MRKSFVMLSVALLAAFGLWFATGSAVGVGVTDQEAAQLVGGCPNFQNGTCTGAGCIGTAGFVSGGTEVTGTLSTPVSCGSCTNAYQDASYCTPG